MKVAAVTFVENTKDGALAKEMREIVEHQKIILGFRIKVVERSETPLRLVFPLSKVGEEGNVGDQIVSRAPRRVEEKGSLPAVKGVCYMKTSVSDVTLILEERRIKRRRGWFHQRTHHPYMWGKHQGACMREERSTGEGIGVELRI